MATILAFYIWGVHWRHLANTIEPSVCGGNEAFCQITLTLITCHFNSVLCFGKSMQHLSEKTQFLGLLFPQ